MRAMRALASFAVAGALFLGGAGAALGQESLLDGLRAAARGAPADAAAALAYGRPPSREPAERQNRRPADRRPMGAGANGDLSSRFPRRAGGLSVAWRLARGRG